MAGCRDTNVRIQGSPAALPEVKLVIEGKQVRAKSGSRQSSFARRVFIDYTYFGDLFREFDLPAQGILSRVLHKDDRLNVTAFGFSAGQELSTHSAPTPAILYFLEGEGEVQLGNDKRAVRGGSFVYMPPNLPHGISATSPLRMLLVQIKEVQGAGR